MGVPSALPPEPAQPPSASRCRAWAPRPVAGASAAGALGAAQRRRLGGARSPRARDDGGSPGRAPQRRGAAGGGRSAAHGGSAPGGAQHRHREGGSRRPAGPRPTGAGRARQQQLLRGGRQLAPRAGWLHKLHKLRHGIPCSFDSRKSNLSGVASHVRSGQPEAVGGGGAASRGVTGGHKLPGGDKGLRHYQQFMREKPGTASRRIRLMSLV